MTNEKQIMAEWEKREAYNVKRYETLRRYVHFFRNRGWQLLEDTGGIFNVAILLSPCGTKVAKFADLESDDGWPLFARWAIMRNSPHLPKFYTVREMRCNYMLGIMERLSPLPALYMDLDWPDYCDHLTDAQRQMVWDARNFDAAARLATVDTMESLSFIARISSKTLRAFAVALQDAFKGRACDTHEGNVMVRPITGEVVIMDPYGYKYREPVPTFDEVCGIGPRPNWMH